MSLEKQRTEAMRSGNLAEFYQQFIDNDIKPRRKPDEKTRFVNHYTIAELKTHFFDCCDSTIRNIVYSSGLFDEMYKKRKKSHTILIEKSLIPELIEKMNPKYKIYLKQF